MSKKHVVEKSENRDCLKRILSSIRFLTRQGMSFLAKNHDPKRLQYSPKRIKPIKKEHRSAQNSKKTRSPNERGEWYPSYALHPFTPPALNGFLCRTTLKYMATALSLRLSWPLGIYVCEVFLFFCHFPIRCSGSGVVLDCNDS